MLTIRLQRTGTKNKPDFRIVLAESKRAAGKKFIEVLGHYNPRTKNFGISDDVRLKHWLAKNVSMSATVHNLFVEKKLIDQKKVKAWQPKKKEGAESPAAAAPAAEAPKAEAAPTEIPAPEAAA